MLYMVPLPHRRIRVKIPHVGKCMTQYARDVVRKYEPKQCEHVRSDGLQCGGYKNTGTDYCVAHQVEGVDVNELPSISSMEDLKDFTVQTMYQLKKGMISEREAAITKDYIALVQRQLAQIESPDQADQAAKIAAALSDDSDTEESGGET
jgi:hypothetical protein